MMWEVEDLTVVSYVNAYVIRNKRTGGYLADNSTNAGALHFHHKYDAEVIVSVLNNYPPREVTT